MDSSHGGRIFSAILFGSILLILLYLTPRWTVQIGMLLGALLGGYEYYPLVINRAGSVERWAYSVLLGSLAFLFATSTNCGGWLLGLFVLSFLYSILTVEDPVSVMEKASGIFLGIVTISFSLAHLPRILSFTDGNRWIFFLVTVIWAGDIAAYYSGTTWGRNRFFPALSPKRTWEGCIGGILGSMLVALLFRLAFLSRPSLPYILFIGVILEVAGQLGDLYESALKRIGEVKDSGSLFPGHGGMLDRIDSLLFSVPLLYYLISFKGP